jgi:hypothetical protein
MEIAPLKQTALLAGIAKLLAVKPFDDEYARVVYRIVNDNMLVITFYPVKRERFNV